MAARRAPLLATLVLAAAVGLTACVPSPPQAPVESTPETSAPETSAAPSESADEEPAEAPSGDVAPAGAEFTIGEPATVEILNVDDEPQLVTITVTGTRAGSLDDFAAAGFDQEDIDQLVGYTPLYVDVEMAQVAPMTAELAYGAIYTDFGAVDQSGTDLTDIPVIGSFEPCDSESIPSEFDSGTVHTTCVVVATREGQELGGVVYDPYGTIYDGYDGEPLVWRP